jgi:ParB family chromosome partitioning protein
MPANIPIEIARAPDGDVQRAPAEAYKSKLLPGNQILAIRRIIHSVISGAKLCRAATAALRAREKLPPHRWSRAMKPRHNGKS